MYTPPFERHQRRRRRLGYLLSGAVLVIGAAGLTNWYLLRQVDSEAPAASANTVQSPQPAAPAPPPFDKTKLSHLKAGSLWVVVNKTHPLSPKSYTPDKVAIFKDVPIRADVKPHLVKMFADAKKDGVNLSMVSGYRSYSYQKQLFNSYARRDGIKAAEAYSARPGYSEHQTGLAADIGSADHPGCTLEDCYAKTPAGKWLAENVYKYGFIVRYTDANHAVTGYIPEPWHLRFVGTELSNYYYDNHVSSLEEFFGVSGGDYSS
ncbi:MAG TPA: M15 family metallopeptidase [Candidatus Saccharimonadales bacterium]|nr:M15 family metallopeptidase [Candidatus Saccharimonadales bacterium]